MLLDGLKKDGAPWRSYKPKWFYEGSKHPTAAQNYESKRPYGLINSLFIDMTGKMPFLVSKDKALALGLKKTAKAIFILSKGAFCKDDNGARRVCGEADPEKVFFEKLTAMYSVQDVQGFDLSKIKNIKENKPFEDLDYARRIAESAGAETEIEPGTAFYQPSGDFVNIPPKSQFGAAAQYYATWFHELIHWTGHGKRLKRDFKGRFGSKEYAFEELVAEIGASYLCGEAGIFNYTAPDASGYIKSWGAVLSKNLAEDPMFFIKAALEAEKAANYVLSFSEKNATKSLGEPVPSAELASERYEKAPIPAPYNQLLGEISADAVTMVYGDAGAGKTTNLLSLCRGLCAKGQKTLYVSFEQFGTESLNHALARAGGPHKNLYFCNGEKLDKPYTAPFGVLVLDSISAAGWGIEQLRGFLKENKGKFVIFVAQSTKEGAFRGGNDLKHEADTVVKITATDMFTEKNRYGALQNIKNPFGAKPLEGVKDTLQAKEAEIAKKKKNG